MHVPPPVAVIDLKIDQRGKWIRTVSPGDPVSLFAASPKSLD